MSSLRRPVINLYHRRQCLLQHRFHSVFRTVRLRTPVPSLLCTACSVPVPVCPLPVPFVLFPLQSVRCLAASVPCSAVSAPLSCSLFPGSILCLFHSLPVPVKALYPKASALPSSCIYALYAFLLQSVSTSFSLVPYSFIIAFHNAPVKEQKAQHKVFSIKKKTAASPRLFFP